MVTNMVLVCGAPLFLKKIHLNVWLGTYTMMCKTMKCLHESIDPKHVINAGNTFPTRCVMRSLLIPPVPLTSKMWIEKKWNMRPKVTSWKAGRFKTKTPHPWAWRCGQQLYAPGKHRTGISSSGFKNGSLWNSDLISFRVLPAWELMPEPVPSIWVKDLITQKTKQETPNIKKLNRLSSSMSALNIMFM